MSEHILRATELPPYAAVYLVEETEDGPRRAHVAEVTPWNGAPGIMDIRTGNLVRVLHLPDDGRRLEVAPYGWASVPDVDPDDPHDDDLGDLAADRYERGLGRHLERRGW